MKTLSIQQNVQYILEEPPVYVGSLSSVYKGQELGLNRPVAVKVVPLASMDKRRRAALRSEVNICCACAEWNSRAPLIYQCTEQNNTLYLIMQWMTGRTLRAEMAEKTLTDADRLRLSVGLCEAVAPLHRHHMQHRDLKPENIQVTAQNVVYMMDFNITAAIPYQGVGTDGYLAPEACGLSVQPDKQHVDVFAIGAILYELFTGMLPVFGLDYVCESKARDWSFFASPADHRPDLPAGISDIITKCMALQGTARYRDANQVLQALRRIRL